MAPEVLRKEKFTEKSDMWSVGVVLYVLLTGRMPYREKEAKKL
jgi:serine/threonine-protein kinase ULK/ATG1